MVARGLIAFEEVPHTDNSEELRQEYNALCILYLQCNADSFTIPRAVPFSDQLAGFFFRHCAQLLLCYQYWPSDPSRAHGLCLSFPQ